MPALKNVFRRFLDDFRIFHLATSSFVKLEWTEEGSGSKKRLSATVAAQCLSPVVLYIYRTLSFSSHSYCTNVVQPRLNASSRELLARFYIVRETDAARDLPHAGCSHHWQFHSNKRYGSRLADLVAYVGNNNLLLIPCISGFLPFLG